MNLFRQAQNILQEECEKVLNNNPTPLCQNDIQNSLARVEEVLQHLSNDEKLLTKLESQTNDITFYLKLLKVIGRTKDYWDRTEKLTTQDNTKEILDLSDFLENQERKLREKIANLPVELAELVHSTPESRDLLASFHKFGVALKDIRLHDRTLKDIDCMSDWIVLDNPLTEEIRNFKISMNGHGVFDPFYPKLLKLNRENKNNSYLLFSLRELILIFYNSIEEPIDSTIHQIFLYGFMEPTSKYNRDNIRKNKQTLKDYGLIPLPRTQG